MTKRKESGVELPSSPRESGKKVPKRKGPNVQPAKLVRLRGVGYPFRLRGDPKLSGVEVDDMKLFSDYAREQWLGSPVYSGMYLFDRFVMPDFAFEVIEVNSDGGVITKNTQICLAHEDTPKSIPENRVLFDEIIGHEAVKRKCRLIAKYLQYPSAFGEWAPRAVLFHGLPGTGKTLTARALASEGGTSFFSIRAPDLIGVHVGDGGRRISSLFEDARINAPCIVFIDELDAIGLARSFQSIRGDVSEVVTALLGELDKSSEESGVVVIGATNTPNLIDSAIRSRFDAVFEFGLPNEDERIKILELYASRLPIPIDADFEAVARLTQGLSGRDLRDRILKEALHQAISEDMNAISNELILSIVTKLGTRFVPDYTV